MSQSPARERRRFCKRNGHWMKTASGADFWCGNCGIQLNQDGSPVAAASPTEPPTPPKEA